MTTDCLRAASIVHNHTSLQSLCNRVSRLYTVVTAGWVHSMTQCKDLGQMLAACASIARLCSGGTGRVSHFQSFDRRQHILRVARHTDFSPDLRNLALGIDQEGGTLDAHIFFPIH